MDQNELCLVADIGGTYARFAIYDATGSEQRFHLTLAVSRYSTIDLAIAELLQQFQMSAAVDGGAIGVVVLAVAGPIVGDSVQLTNSTWSFSRHRLQQAFGWRALWVLNDFAAIAYSLGHLGDNHLRTIGPELLADSQQTRAVLGPGTGLGVAALVHDVYGMAVLAGEGGHVHFAPVSALEQALLAYLAREHATVQREDLLSGRGLCRLYQAVAAVCGEAVPVLDDPAIITERAVQQPEAFCARVLNVFCGILGSVAADVALEMGATGGVYIGGGIVPRVGDFFAASPFRQRFEAHSSFAGYLQNIPTFLLSSNDTGLLGALVFLQKMLQKHGGNTRHSQR